MPHYSNGRKARVGDVIVGKGYNVKDIDGNLAEIAGTLVEINEGPSCNVRVLYGLRPATIGASGGFGGSPSIIGGVPFWPE